ncbi:MAG: hypothetical protein ACREEA_07275, partial [Stellaceae bacterium]
GNAYSDEILFEAKILPLRRRSSLSAEDVEADTAADPDRFFSYRRACLRGELGHGLGLSTIALAP